MVSALGRASARSWSERWPHRRLPALRLQFMVYSLTGLLLVGCGQTNESVRVQSVNTEDSSQRIERNLRGESLVSRYSPVRLRLPGNWQPVPGNALHPEAEIQAYNPERQIYLVVVGEDQTNVTAAGNLNQQAQIYLELLKRDLDRLIADASPTEISSVNEADAVQHEVQGEVWGAEVAYLHTTVDMNGRYYQVVAWTPRNRYPENAEAMKAIIQQFRPD